MSLAKPEPWPFDWPPAPGSGVELWLPEVQESAIPAMRERICDERLTTVMSERALRVSDRVGVATVADARPYRGGTVVTVSLRRRGWLPEPLTFGLLRYPIASVLGTLFVVSLGFGPPVPPNIYQGCVLLMIAATSIICTMWGIGYHREARDNARRASTRCLHGLGCALADLGARPLPASDSPFRR